MGEFASGRWLIGLSIYFFIVFIVLYGYLSAAAQVGLNPDGTQVNDPGFIAMGQNTSSTTSLNSTSTIDWNNVFQTFAFMYGFSYIIDVPPLFYFIIVFFFIWVPTISFFYALYMALPFFH